MTTRIRLARARLPYLGSYRLHTAISGAIDALHEVYVIVDTADGLHGVGEVRANAAYMSGVAEEVVPARIRDVVERIDWSRGPRAALGALAGSAHDHPALARAAVESALVDLVARDDGVSVAEHLGGRFVPGVETNQCLFWSEDDGAFIDQAERYVDEGFRDLKVRVGIRAPERDLSRLRLLRDRFADGVRIAIDANGRWNADEALRFLEQAAPVGLDYCEQPTRIGDWAAFERVGREGPVPPMLDEGLKTVGDVRRLAALGAPFLAHLKISKMGGPRAVVEAARELTAAGVGIMVGQMNEGALATALTVHCAMVVRPLRAELYGCYGVSGDPASGVAYRDGRAWVPQGPGLAVPIDESRLETGWEIMV